MMILRCIWMISSLHQVLWVTLCPHRSTQMCLSPQMGVITGGGHWGVLTTTAYWTLGVSLWLWRPSVKDKSRRSSTEYNETIVLFVNGGLNVLICKVSFHLNCSELYINSAPISCHQVLHRRRPVLEVLQLHRTALLLCRPGIRAGDQGHERQRVGLPARGWWPAHVGGCHHWFPEPHYKRVWVKML